MKEFQKTVTGFEVTENVYVKGDGRTVCAATDKDVAALKFARGERISAAQHAALIFPRRAEPLPDSSNRSYPTLPDTEKRRRGRPPSMGG